MSADLIEETFVLNITVTAHRHPAVELGDVIGVVEGEIRERLLAIPGNDFGFAVDTVKIDFDDRATEDLRSANT